MKETVRKKTDICYSNKKHKIYKMLLVGNKILSV